MPDDINAYESRGFFWASFNTRKGQNPAYEKEKKNLLTRHNWLINEMALCKICEKEQSKYKCPKCRAP